MNADTPEQHLLKKAIDGDQGALEELLLVHCSPLARRIRRKLPPALSGLFSEEDVVQQTFAAAFLRITTFQTGGKWAFYRWLCTIADHILIDAVKAQHAAKRGGGRVARSTGGLLDDSMDDLLDVLAGPQETPSRAAARDEAASAVQTALQSLGEDNRRAIELLYIQGVPLAEVAKKMGRTQDAIRSLCYRGVKELRIVLGRTSQFFSHR